MRKVPLSLCVCFCRFFSLAYGSELPDRCGLDGVKDAVAVDVVRPVRQGGMNGQAYWNERSVMFMHPPSFDFKKVEGAVRYRYVIEDDARKDYRFEAATPNETLARIWAQLPDGMLRLEVLAIGRKNRPVGLAGYRRFWKSPAFDPAVCPRGVCGYAEASAKYYDWLWNTPMVQSYLKNGVPCEDYVYSSFPCKTDGAIVRAFVKYATMCPERAAASLTVARRAADFLISLMLPAGSPLEHFPPTYRILKPAKPFDSKNIGADEIAKRYSGQNMIVYPAMVADFFLDLYEAVGEAKYLAAAKRIAGTYVKLQGEDGSWFLKLNEKDGTPVAQNRLFPLQVCSLMERLYAITGSRVYRETADRGFAYVDKGPLSDWNWEAQYEDVEPSHRFRNLTIHTPVQTAMYLLKRYPDDPKRRAQARECLRFAEDQFVAWKPPFRTDGTGPLGKDSPMIVKGDASAWFQVPGAFEQYDWYLPIDSAAAKMIRGYLAFYKIEGALVDLEKARALGNAITIMQKLHGKGGAIPTHWLKWEVGPEVDTQPWINCGIATANTLADLAAAVGDASQRKDTGHE